MLELWLLHALITGAGNSLSSSLLDGRLCTSATNFCLSTPTKSPCPVFVYRPRAPGGIPRFSAVVPQSSRGLTAGTCTGSHFSCLPPLPSCEARKETKSWRLPQKKQKPPWPKMATQRACASAPHAVCDVRHTPARACTRIVTLYTQPLCAAVKVQVQYGRSSRSS